MGLGMAVEVFDDNGKSITEKDGELVCTESFHLCQFIFGTILTTIYTRMHILKNIKVYGARVILL